MNITDRIKKLLRLSKSPNIHEAQLALERAFEIAAKYQIDIQTLNLGEELNTIVSEAYRVGLRLSLTKRLALNLIALFYNVNVVHSQANAVLIGKETDIKIAQYVLEFIVLSIDASVRECRKFVGHRFTENARRNYIHGWFYAVIRNIEQHRDQLLLENKCFALILSKNDEQRRAKQTEIFPRLKSIPTRLPKRINKNFLNLGYIQGEKFRITAGLDGSNAVRGLI